MVALGADYRLRQDDIPELQMLLAYGHFRRAAPHLTNIATTSALPHRLGVPPSWLSRFFQAWHAKALVIADLLTA